MKVGQHNILALDLGTKTGYAVNPVGSWLTAGTWQLGSASQIKNWGQMRLTRRSDPRVTNLYTAISPTIINGQVDQVVFEDVQFASSTYQTQLWASLRAAVWLAVRQNPNVLIECVPTGTLKKFATGHGGATKEMMAAALLKKESTIRWDLAKLHTFDDNAIDAIWLWYWADTHLRQAHK